MSYPGIALIVASICVIIFLSCEKAPSGGWLNEVIYIENEGAAMPAHVHGNAANKSFLVVLHGAGSFGLSFRKGPFTEKLESENAVVYVDQRGQSMAQGQYSSPDDLISLMADDVKALIAVLQFRYGVDIRIFLLGHSWGGLLGGQTLMLEGVQDQVAGWINVAGLLDVPSISDRRKALMLEVADEHIGRNQGREEWQQLKEELQNIPTADNQNYDVILQKARKVVQLLHKYETVSHTARKESIYRALVSNNPIHWWVGSFFNQPVQQAIDNHYTSIGAMGIISIPTLFIYGKYDVSVPPSVGTAAFEHLATDEKRMFIFERSIHHPFDTEAERFAKEVQHFINAYK